MIKKSSSWLLHGSSKILNRESQSNLETGHDAVTEQIGGEFGIQFLSSLVPSKVMTCLVSLVSLLVRLLANSTATLFLCNYSNFVQLVCDSHFSVMFVAFAAIRRDLLITRAYVSKIPLTRLNIECFNETSY